MAAFNEKQTAKRNGCGFFLAICISGFLLTGALSLAQDRIISGRSESGGTSISDTVNLDKQIATISADNAGNSANITVNAKQETVTGQLRTTDGNTAQVQYDAKKESVSATIAGSGGESAIQVNAKKQTAETTTQVGDATTTIKADAKKQTVSTDITTAQGSGNAKVDFTKGVGEINVQSGSTEANTTVDVNKGKYQAGIKTDDYNANAKVDAQKGTAQVKYESDNLASKTDVNVKKQTVATEFESGDVSGGGKVDLKKGTASGHVDVGQPPQTFSAQNQLGTVEGTLKAGAEADASLKVSKDRVDVKVSGQIGLAAELEAISERVGFGDENVNASAQVSAKIEAAIAAKGAVGLHIDKTGITIGLDAQAGAYISAEVKVNFEFNFFGIKTNVLASAEGHAGVLAKVKAVVKIGFNGKVKFQLSGGVSIGIGGSVGVEFEIDASELMERLNLPDLSALLEWIEKFQEDPQKAFQELATDAAKRLAEAGVQFLVDKLAEPVRNLVENVIIPSIENIPDVISNKWTDFTNWINPWNKSGFGNSGVGATAFPPEQPSGDSDQTGCIIDNETMGEAWGNPADKQKMEAALQKQFGELAKQYGVTGFDCAAYINRNTLFKGKARVSGTSSWFDDSAESKLAQADQLCREPVPGDILITRGDTGDSYTYGHVAIVLAYDRVSGKVWVAESNVHGDKAFDVRERELTKLQAMKGFGLQSAEFSPEMQNAVCKVLQNEAVPPLSGIPQSGAGTGVQGGTPPASGGSPGIVSISPPSSSGGQSSSADGAGTGSTSPNSSLERYRHNEYQNYFQKNQK